MMIFLSSFFMTGIGKGSNMQVSNMLDHGPELSEKTASAIRRWIMATADNTEEGGG